MMFIGLTLDINMFSICCRSRSSFDATQQSSVPSESVHPKKARVDQVSSGAFLYKPHMSAFLLNNPAPVPRARPVDPFASDLQSFSVIMKSLIGQDDRQLVSDYFRQEFVCHFITPPDPVPTGSDTIHTVTVQLCISGLGADIVEPPGMDRFVVVDPQTGGKYLEVKMSMKSCKELTGIADELRTHTGFHTLRTVDNHRNTMHVSFTTLYCLHSV